MYLFVGEGVRSSAQPSGVQRVLTGSQPDAEGWCRCAGPNKAEAETLLDWLEANRFAQREVANEDGEGFTVAGA
jgi:hypothetical protein